MNPVAASWRSFWFAPSGAVDLAAARILFFAVLLVLYLPHEFAAWADVSPVFWSPVLVFDVLRLGVLPAGALLFATLVWKLSLATSCLGLFTRPSVWTSFVLGFYLLGVEDSFSKIHHRDPLLVLVLGVLAVSRCGDAWSLDRWRARRRVAAPPATASGEYTWPLQLVRTLMVIVFFAAGIAKLRGSGLAWAFSDNLSHTIVRNYYGFSSTPPLSDWGLALARHPRLCGAAAAATLALELLAPLALFAAAARALIVPALFLLLVGFRFLLGPDFVAYLSLIGFWIPWHPALSFRAAPGSLARR